MNPTPDRRHEVTKEIPDVFEKMDDGLPYRLDPLDDEPKQGREDDRPNDHDAENPHEFFQLHSFGHYIMAHTKDALSGVSVLRREARSWIAYREKARAEIDDSEPCEPADTLVLLNSQD